MRKRFYLILLLLFVLIISCTQKQDSNKNIENALLIEPVVVTDKDMLALKEVPNFPESTRKVAVVLGYGYNDEQFVSTTWEKLESVFGFADNGGSIIPLVYPKDFMRTGIARISMLSSILKDTNANALVIVGAPEGTHRILSTMQDAGGGSIGYPVISLLPQDNVLGMEATCDLVIDYMASSNLESAMEEETTIYLDNVPDLIERAVYYISIVPDDVVNGFGQKLSELTMHAKLLAGGDWTVSQYVDPETGIRPNNHFVIEKVKPEKEKNE